MYLHHIGSMAELGKEMYIHAWWLMLIYIGNKSNMLYSTKEVYCAILALEINQQSAYNRRSEGRM